MWQLAPPPPPRPRIAMFSSYRNSFWNLAEIIRTNYMYLAKFGEEWTANVTCGELTRFYYSHIWKNAPPPGSHVFKRTESFSNWAQISVLQIFWPCFMKIGIKCGLFSVNKANVEDAQQTMDKRRQQNPEFKWNNVTWDTYFIPRHSQKFLKSTGHPVL